MPHIKTKYSNTIITTAIILSSIIYSISAVAQPKKQLFYFERHTKNETFTGVKDAQGNIIIPAEIPNSFVQQGKGMVTENLITFTFCPPHIEEEKGAIGCVFNRQGKYLYQTFAYDMGPDYPSEGYQRIVHNGKVGFANRAGTIVIQPQYDFATPFKYGYADFCNGCHWKWENEHGVVVGGNWGVVNFKGEEVVATKIKTHTNTINLNGRYYPYPFSYSPKEQKILDFFNQKKTLLAKILYKDSHTSFEIVERPQDDFPFYVINYYGYEKRRIGSDSLFLVSENGKQFFYNDYYNGKTPFETWLAKSTSE